MSDVTEAPDEKPLPPPKNAAEFIGRILKEAGVSDEDFGSTPQVQGFFDVMKATWEFGERVPMMGSQTILYIARDENERRVYSAPLPRANMSMEDKALLEKDVKQGKAFCICWHITNLGVDMEPIDPDALTFLMGRDIRAAVDDFVGASEFENALEYLRGLPAGTSLQTAIAGLEAEEHMEDVEVEGAPNGVGVAAPPATPTASAAKLQPSS